MEENKAKRPVSKVGIVFAALIAAAAGLFCFELWRLSIVPKKYLIPATAAIIVLAALLALLQFIRKGKIVARVIAAAAVILFGVGSYYAADTANTIKKVVNAVPTTAEMCVFVLDDNPAQTLSDLKDSRFGVIAGIEQEKTDEALLSLTELYDKEPDATEYESIISLAAAIENGEVDAMLINGGFISLLDEETGHYELAERLRIIDTMALSQPEPTAEPLAKKDDITSKPFAVYITGNDNFGSLKVQGRGDLNIIMAVDPEAHKIILLFTPRDYYIRLSVNGEYDKLTHCTIYGTQCSIDTLSNLYNIPIDYYVRMNFSGFINIMDALGGVDVDNDIAFSTEKYDYPVGPIHLEGEKALMYCRIRKAFAGGDRVRGVHQQMVIESVIHKICSPAILTSYSDLMAAVSESFETNLSAEDIAALVQLQLESGEKWEISMLNADGEGDNGENYSLPAYRGYRMIPYPDLVESISKTMREFLQLD